MKRYDIQSWCDRCGDHRGIPEPELSDDGDWVRYNDAADEMTAAKNSLGQLRTDLAYWRSLAESRARVIEELEHLRCPPPRTNL
jgi:hypothetical protein